MLDKLHVIKKSTPWLWFELFYVLQLFLYIMLFRKEKEKRKKETERGANLERGVFSKIQTSQYSKVAGWTWIIGERGDCDGGLGGYDGGEGGESGGGRRPALRQVCPHIKVLIEFINRLFIFNAWF